jgi:hypothetical protein
MSIAFDTTLPGPDSPTVGHQDYHSHGGKDTYFTLILTVSEAAELIATFSGPILFSGKAWYRGPALRMTT